MNVEARLVIEFYCRPDSSLPPNIRGYLHTNDPSLKSDLESLGYQFTEVGTNVERWLRTKIEVPEDSDQYRAVRILLSDHGWKESSTNVILVDHRRSHFGFDLKRQITKEQLDQSELLLVIPADLTKIANWCATDNRGYVLAADARLKNRMTLGWVRTIIVPYASEEGREQLRSGHLDGLDFIPARFDRPDKVTKPLYQISSRVTLPKCRLSLQDHLGQVSVCGGSWSDGGYSPPILRYIRKDVDALRPFDIALTLEKMGGLPTHHRHNLIVSQRFRRHLANLKIRGFGYIPVVLED